MKKIAISACMLLSACATVPDDNRIVVEPNSEAISSNTLLADVGLETKAGFAPFLRQGCSLPCVMTVNFSNAGKNSEQILLKMTRTDVQDASSRISLGTYSVTGFHSDSAGKSTTNIEFRADSNGISIAPTARNPYRLSITRVAP